MKKLVSIIAIGSMIGAALCAAAAFAAVFMSLSAGPPGDPWGDWLSHLGGELFALSRVFILIAAVGAIPYLALYVNWSGGVKEQEPRHPENKVLD